MYSLQTAEIDVHDTENVDGIISSNSNDNGQPFVILNLASFVRLTSFPCSACPAAIHPSCADSPS